MENSSSGKRGRKGLWKPEEDMILKHYIETHGEGNWPTVSLRSGLMRGGKSCRLRWKNYLRPNIKRGSMSKEEEDLIIRMHKLLGNRWSLIAGRLPGRTDNEVKNYWNTHLNKIRRRLNKRTTLEPRDRVKAELDDSEKKSSKVQPQMSIASGPAPAEPDLHHQRDLSIVTNSHWIGEGDARINGYDIALEPYYSSLAPMLNHSSNFVFDDELLLPPMDSLVWLEAFGFQS